MKMPKLKKHILQCKEFIVNSKNRTLSLQVVSNGVPLGQLDHFEFNSPYHSRTFQTISINLIFYLHLLSYNFKWYFLSCYTLQNKCQVATDMLIRYEMWRYILLVTLNRVPLILKFPIAHSTKRPALKSINH